MTVISGGFGAIDAVMGGSPTQDALQYFNQSYNNVVAAAQSIGNAAVQQIYQVAANAYQHIMDTRPWEIAEAVIRQTSAIFDPNAIRPCLTIADLQTAKPIMQRWIMACPEIRTMYHNGQLEGYNGSYEDPQPNLVGADQYEYRRATSGMIAQTNSDNDEQGWSATTYFEKLLEGDQPLTHLEKVDIGITWAACMAHIRTQQYDPTSVFNSRL